MFVATPYYLSGAAGGQIAIVHEVAKKATEGAADALQEKVTSEEVAKKAKEAASEVARGVTEDVAKAVPQTAAELARKVAAERKALSVAADSISTAAARSAVAQTAQVLEQQLGRDGEGPLAESLVATTERMASAVVRGVVRELPVWTAMLVFASGSLFTLICGLAFSLLRPRRVGYARNGH